MIDNQKSILPDSSYEDYFFRKDQPLNEKQNIIEQAIVQLEELVFALESEDEAAPLLQKLRKLLGIRFKLIEEQKKKNKTIIGRICGAWASAFSSSKNAKAEKKEFVAKEIKEKSADNKTIFSVIRDLGRYLWTSDSRVTIWEGRNKEVSQKMKILVREIFFGEINVGKARRSLLGKTNMEFITQEGKQLSKAEMIDVTVAKISEIQSAIKKTPKDESNKEEIRSLQKRLVIAEQLMGMLLEKNVVEYLSIKREALFSVMKAITALSAVIDFIKVKPVEAYENWSYNRSIKQVIAPYTLFRKEEEVTLLKKKIDQAIDLLKTNPSAFENAVDTILQENTSSNQPKIIREIFGHKNKALMLAMKQGNTRATHFLISKGLYHNVSKKLLNELYMMPRVSLENRELLIQELFAKTNDHNSIVRTIDYLKNIGEVKMAETLLLETLRLENHKLDSPKYRACLCMAAKVGTDSLLQAAFGIYSKNSLEEMIQLVKPFVMLPDPKGNTLLSYACGGHNANFVTAVNLAIKEKHLEIQSPEHQIRELEIELQEYIDNGMPAAAIEAIKGKINGLKNPKNQKNYRERKKDALDMILRLSKDSEKSKNIPFYLKDMVIKQFPELSYLSDLKKGDLVTLVKGEINNLDLDPFLIRNNQYVRPLQMMSSALASDMDALLEKNAVPLSNGEKPKVDCFAQAVQYYNVLRSKTSANANLLGFIEQFYSWFTYLNNILPAHIPEVAKEIKHLMMTKSTLASLYGGVFGGFVAVWYAREVAEDDSTAYLQGYNRNLEQFQAAYPNGKPISNGLVAVPSVSERYTTLGSTWNPFSSTLQERNIARKMDEQDTSEVLRLLENLKNKKDVVGSEILQGYSNLIRFPENTRSQVFEALFNCLNNAKDINEAIDIQLNAGIKGRECIKTFFYEQAKVWSKETVAPYQYEAALFAAVKLGDVELLDALLQNKLAALQFGALGGWERAGDADISLLHAALGSKYHISSSNKAVIAKKIYEEIIKARKYKIQVDPNSSNDFSDPLTVARKGVLPLDLVHLTEASALDKEFGLDPNRPGSFTHTVQLRARLSADDDNDQALIGFTPALILGRFGAPLSNIVAFAAASAASKYGPVSMFAADVAARMAVVKLFALLGATTGSILGQGFSQTLHQIEHELYTTSSTISQLGGTQEEREYVLNRCKEDLVVIQKYVDLKTDVVAIEYLLKGLEQAIIAASESGDFLSCMDLRSIKETIAALPAVTPYKDVVEVLRKSLLKADIPPSLRFIISQNNFFTAETQRK